MGRAEHKEGGGCKVLIVIDAVVIVICVLYWWQNFYFRGKNEIPEWILDDKVHKLESDARIFVI